MVLLKSDENTLSKGDNAPDFKLKNVDGKEVSLKDFKDMPIVIIFMCNHCPYVKTKFDPIKDLQETFKGKVAVIGINANDAEEYPEDSYENMQTLAEKYGYNYYLHDETQEVAKSYGATCTPDPFVFDKDHKLIFHGRINNSMSPNEEATEDTMKLVLEKHLAGEEINPWFNPSMGCSIKWKE